LTVQKDTESVNRKEMLIKGIGADGA